MSDDKVQSPAPGRDGGAVRNGPGPGVRRRVARTDVLLADPRLADATRRLGAGVVKAAVRAAQERVRTGEVPATMVIDAVTAALPRTASGTRPVINATGVLLHTNLGRAPLSAAARDAVLDACGFTDVELDLRTGRRARRGRTVIDALLGHAPAAEAAHVVNNGAAALVLAATALAAHKEIVISRGEMVEIGDGFRLPDLLVSTGARLREVGTTNRTSPADYAAALGPDTGFILKVHPSNFVISGFTQRARIADLAPLGIPIVADIGSGLLAPDPRLPDEPDAGSCLRAGASVVTASGDKLLGGPQCGVVLGRHDLVQRMARHPLARALRTDKLTLAGLEATLRGPRTPTYLALHEDEDALRARAERTAAELRGSGIDAEAVESRATVGGGGAPGVTLGSAAVSLPDGYAARLREGSPAVMGRIEDGRCLLDLRAVPAESDGLLLGAVLAAAAQPEEGG